MVTQRHKVQKKKPKHNVEFLLNLDMSILLVVIKILICINSAVYGLPLLFIYYNCFKKGMNHREDIRFLKFHVKVCCLQKCHTWQQICPLSADSFTVKVSHSELESRFCACLSLSHWFPAERKVLLFLLHDQNCLVNFMLQLHTGISK